MSEDIGFKDYASWIVGLQLVILFFVLTGAVLHYGVAPAMEFIASLFDLSAYQKGVKDTLMVLFFIGVFIYVALSGPRRI